MKKNKKQRWHIKWATDNIKELERYQGEQVLVHPVLGVLVHGTHKDFQFKVDAVKKSIRKRCKTFGATTLATSFTNEKVRPVVVTDQCIDPFETGYGDHGTNHQFTGCFKGNTWVDGATVDEEYDRMRREGF